MGKGVKTKKNIVKADTKSNSIRTMTALAGKQRLNENSEE
jgi:hypothetical protein